MATILLIHEDGMLRGQHRKILEKQGYTVSEISHIDDRVLLPKNLVFTSIITELCPIPTDYELDHFPLTLELDHANHPSH